MSYSDFTIDSLKEKFQLEFIEDQPLFAKIPDYTVPSELLLILEKFLPLALAIDTEKARSELIIAPLLAELKLNLKEISLFSGIEFHVDKTLGLNGCCDFIISKSKEQYSLNAPVLVMVEAKNDNIKSSYTIQDLIIQPYNTRYRLEKWQSPSGAYIIASVPNEVKGRHYGPTLISFIIHQYYNQHVTQPLLLEQLSELGIEISSGQLSRILTENQDSFHQEQEEISIVG